MEPVTAYGLALNLSPSPVAVPAGAAAQPPSEFDAFGLAHVNRLEASVWGAILIIGAALYVNALYD